MTSSRSDPWSLVFDVELCARNVLRAPANGGARAELHDALDRLKAVTDTEKAERRLAQVEGLPERRDGEPMPEPPAHHTDVPPLLAEDPGRTVEPVRALPAVRKPYNDD